MSGTEDVSYHLASVEAVANEQGRLTAAQLHLLTKLLKRANALVKRDTAQIDRLADLGIDAANAFRLPRPDVSKLTDATVIHPETTFRELVAAGFLRECGFGQFRTLEFTLPEEAIR